MKLIYIYGPPGVGKLTVATEVARRTGYKLFHNHLSIAVIEPVFEFGTETFWRLVHRIREDVIESAAQDGVDIVYTSVYGHPRDIPLVMRRFDPHSEARRPRLSRQTDLRAGRARRARGV